MGAVYRAQDLRFNVKKIVAVKEMINKATDEDTRKTIIENFEREANILATVNHPAIPTIYDYFTLGSRSYLVMEFIRGVNLENKLHEAGGPLEEEMVIGWGIALCDVLEYLHTQDPEPIIFRDVKPANILINKKNQITLVDFGIAKTFQTGTKGTMIGTEGYSPRNNTAVKLLPKWTSMPWGRQCTTCFPGWTPEQNPPSPGMSAPSGKQTPRSAQGPQLL